MPFNFQNKDRMDNLIEELEGLRYRNLHEVGPFDWYEDDGAIGRRAPEGEPVKQVEKGFIWSGWDQYNWLCTKLSVPEDVADSKDGEAVGLFDFGVPKGTGNNSHFESLLYVNGAPFQAMDGNHKEVFLKPGENGRELDLKFRVWSGLNGGGRPKDMYMRIERAQIGILDKAADDFYYMARTALETYALLSDDNEYKEWLLNRVVLAFDKVDYTEPGSPEFYASIKEARDYLDGQLQGQGKPDVHVSLLGHTHIDVAWLWRLRHTREKAARSFSTVNRLMERHENYVFLQSQAQLYEYIKEDYPEIYAHIKKRVAEGKWEPSGSMWVECDCNIASGEAIIRQILVGKNFFRQEFGYENTFLWLPDVFGYSWALPQILKKSGVDTFMTTKISWNDTNILPYDTFLWKGMDGTAVTTHFVTTPGSDKETPYTYNGDTRPYAFKGVWDTYKNKDMNKDLLISFGYGDGGGGPNRDMLKTMETLEKMPGLPHVRTETATEYFDRLNKTIRENPMEGYLPVWDGELYLEFHRGTYTSQAYNKKMNRRMEFRLRQAEMLGVLAGLLSGESAKYDKENLLKAWKIVLCEQFHDILPGSSIHEVYEDSHEEYGRAEKMIAQAEELACGTLLAEDKNVFTVFNSFGWSRSGCVRLPGTDGAASYCNEAGEELVSVSRDGADYVWMENLSPLSFTGIVRIVKEEKEKQGQAAAERVAEESRFVESPFYEVSWNGDGRLVRIYDKKAGREVLAEGKEGNCLQVFEDKPRCFDAWELEPTIDRKREEIRNCEKVSVEKNEMGTFVTFVYGYHNSKITQTLCLYEKKRRIDFRTNVDWHEHQKLLKTAFPVNIRAVSARYDIQEGNIVRPVTENTSWQAAQFEVAAHKWADFSETGYGVALLNDCKYGHDIKGDTIRLTLLKSAVDPDYCADNGTHEFTYALLPHAEEWYAANIEQEAFALNNPLVAMEGKYKGAQESLFTFSADNVEVDAIKLAENSDEIVLRFHEFTGARKDVKIETAVRGAKWCECNLMEEPCSEWQEGDIVLPVKPYEIKTILIKTR